MAKRIQMNLTDQDVKVLVSLQDMTGWSISEAVRDSLRITHWLSKELREGKKICIKEEGEGLKEIVIIPIL